MTINGMEDRLFRCVDLRARSELRDVAFSEAKRDVFAFAQICASLLLDGQLLFPVFWRYLALFIGATAL
jgi:hypothetical protein